MSTRNRLAGVAAGLVLAAGLLTAQLPESAGSFRIAFPQDAPVAVVSADWGQSRPASRGGAVLLDLHSALSLRNLSGRRIRGVTLIVLAQEVTPGGKGSVTVPSLNVGPGETFPVRIDLQLLRPVQALENAPVQVGLDGVLFDDLSFYGPNRLNSKRSMTVWELEAQRDRHYFKSILERAGADGLQKEMLAAMSRVPQTSGGVQVVRGRSTNFEPEHQLQFAFLEFPDSPVAALEGVAQIAGNEARAPRLEVINRSARPVRYLELGWIVEDQLGREFLAGSVPAELNLAPGQKSQVLQETALRFTQRTGIKGMTAFVSHVEYMDGRWWILNRSALNNEHLQRVLPPSPEEQRLVQIYRKRGVNGLIEELKRF